MKVIKMRFTGILFCCTILIWGCKYTSTQNHLKPIAHCYTEVKEPSDICINPVSNTFFVVSDNGYLHETDSFGRILRTAYFEGFDCEGVYANEFFVYVVEEMVRKIRIFDIHSLKLLRTISVPYSGGRNKAYESITYNPITNRFILITEKDPIYIYELDASFNFNIYNEIQVNNLARDISAATFYQNRLFLLSDEDREIIEVDPIDYHVIKRWKIPVINPEGITFKSNKELIIVSDDREKFYFFNANIILNDTTNAVSN